MELTHRRKSLILELLEPAVRFFNARAASPYNAKDGPKGDHEMSTRCPLISPEFAFNTIRVSMEIRGFPTRVSDTEPRSREFTFAVDASCAMSGSSNSSISSVVASPSGRIRVGLSIRIDPASPKMRGTRVNNAALTQLEQRARSTKCHASRDLISPRHTSATAKEDLTGQSGRSFLAGVGCQSVS